MSDHGHGHDDKKKKGGHDDDHKTPPGAKPGQEDGKAMVEETVSFFKQMFNYDLNTIISLANPEIDAAAKRLAGMVSRNIDKDHWLRAKVMQRVMGAISSKVEKTSDSLKQPYKAILEKFSDFLEGFTTALYGGHADDHPPKPAEVQQTLAAFKGFMERFYIRAEKELAKTPLEEMERVSETLDKELAALLMLKGRIEDSLKPSEPAHPPEDPHHDEEPKKTWAERKAEFKEWFEKTRVKLSEQDEKIAASLEETNEELRIALLALQEARLKRPPRPHQEEGMFGKMLLSPWMLIGRLLGFGKPKRPAPVPSTTTVTTIDI